MNLPRVFYTGAVRLATPVVLVHLARRSHRQAHTNDDWRARLGSVAPDMRAPLWIHAASAGEMQSAASLAAALTADYPVHISAFTATGRAVAARLVPEARLDLAPLDLPGAWRRYLERIRPRAGILLETELWPNLLAVAAARRLPIILASARLTPRAARRLARFPGATRAMLGALTQVLTQSEEDLERFVALGLPRARARVTGSLKQTLAVPAEAIAEGRRLRCGPFAGRKVWVAGSVRAGEETAVAAAAARTHATLPDAIAVIVPRHPEEAAGFVRALKAQAVPALGTEALHSGQPLPDGAAVVVDRVGVLLGLYAAADAAFVGGSLVPIEGHNVLEPALLGVPVVAGPRLGNVRAVAERLRAAGALAIVADETELAAAVSALLADPAAAQAAGAAGRHAAADPTALTATIAALRELLLA